MSSIEYEISQIIHTTGFRYEYFMTRGKYLAFLLLIIRQMSSNNKINTVDELINCISGINWDSENTDMVEIMEAIKNYGLYAIDDSYALGEGYKQLYSLSNPELIEFLLMDFHPDRNYRYMIMPNDMYQLIVSLMAIKQGDKVLDQFCGSGSFMFEVTKSHNEIQLFGHDDMNNDIFLAKIKAYLLGEKIDIRIDKLFRNLSFINNNQLAKFDKVFSIYPWSLKYDPTYVEWLRTDLWDKATLEINKRNTSDWLFIALVLNRLAPTGKGIVLVPERILKVKSDANIRKTMVENGYIEAIIKLLTAIEGLPNIRLYILILSFQNMEIAYLDTSMMFYKDRRSNIPNTDEIVTCLSEKSKLNNYNTEQMKGNEYSLLPDDYTL